MKIREFKYLLNTYGLKATRTHLKVLELLSAHENVITHGEIERQLNSITDRVNIYRTLKTFEKYGIIQCIPKSEGSSTYVLKERNKDKNSQQVHKPNINFSCNRCRNMYSVNDPAMPQISLPDMYVVHSLNIVISGICRKCVGA